MSNVSDYPALGFPLSKETLSDFLRVFKNHDNPDGRQVFIFGHGGWNHFESSKSKRWLEQFEDEMSNAMPNFFKGGVLGTDKFPRLFVLPHASASNKNVKFIPTQNNLFIQRHAAELRLWLEQRGYDVLGTFNLTVQATSYDGMHASFENNVVKAMMVFNWLDKL